MTFRVVRVPLLGVLVALAALLGPAQAVHAQDSESRLTERRLQYQAAFAALESARRALSVVERQFSAALEGVDRARRTGDSDVRERALALAQDRSVPLGAGRNRVSDALDALDRARQALVAAITVRMEELLGAMGRASSAAARQDLDQLYDALNQELRSLESEAGESLRINPVVLPEITFDPRDLPEELRSKAEILERRAQAADTAIAEVDRQVEDLRARQRRDRMRADFMAGTDRFDDTRVPVVSTRQGGEDVPPGDSIGVSARPLTIEDRIEGLLQYRAQLEGYRNQLLVRARGFRQAIRRIT